MYDTRGRSSVLTVQHGHPVESVLLYPSDGILLSAGKSKRKLRLNKSWVIIYCVPHRNFGIGEWLTHPNVSDLLVSFSEHLHLAMIFMILCSGILIAKCHVILKELSLHIWKNRTRLLVAHRTTVLV